jgi:hypothetical protein
MPLVMLTVIILTANHYILDAVGGIAVMLMGMLIAIGGKKFATRVVSPDSKAAREKGWVSWMYWLFGVAEPQRAGRRIRQTA